MRRRWRRLPQEVRNEIIGLAAGGATYREILDQIDVSEGAVTNVLGPLGGVLRVDGWEPSSDKRLSVDERVDIGSRLGRGCSYREIARSLGRAPSTVSREVAANGGRDGYKPLEAHRRARENTRRPKPTKLSVNPELLERVRSDLKKLWSPEQISGRLRKEFGDDPTMNISHETIYRSLYVQGRGELARELTACLRTGRAKRKQRGRETRVGKNPDMVMISDRPAEVEDRAVPGHWEGDLILGKGGKSAMGTVVERTTRYFQPLHLPNGRTAPEVRTALTSAMVELPETLRRSLTWDQGKEMAQHVQFSVDTDIDVYFCDPHSPWQRGTNENTNGLLRQYFPKGTDLSIHTPDELQAAAGLRLTLTRRIGWENTQVWDAPGVL
ncbi:MAG: IS30 family transposase [Acidimicrobiia bacterium]|nr:IS30 family transposase [Acidimicrobiia bacterium]